MPLIGSGLLSSSGAAFVGAYDGISNLAAVYSVRRVLTSYTGPLLRLRRDSDNAESDFGYVAANGDLDTAAIATWLGAATGYVATWYDQGASGLDATQATAGNQPLFTLSAATEKPNSLVFDGTNDVLTTSIISWTSGANMIIVARNAVRKNYNGMVGINGNGYSFYWQEGATDGGSGNITVYKSSNILRKNDGAPPVGAFYIYSYAGIGAALNLYYAGTNVAGPVNVGDPPAGVVSIGNVYGYHNGNISELAVFSPSIGSTADHNTIGSSMASYYGLTWNTIA